MAARLPTWQASAFFTSTPGPQNYSVRVCECVCASPPPALVCPPRFFGLKLFTILFPVYLAKDLSAEHLNKHRPKMR